MCFLTVQQTICCIETSKTIVKNAHFLVLNVLTMLNIDIELTLYVYQYRYYLHTLLLSVLHTSQEWTKIKNNICW